MAYPPRVEFPGALHHVMNRGNRKSEIFLEDRDRTRFLDLIGATVTRFGWLCHAYCLMGNHYHLLIETPGGNLGRGMQWFGARYSRWFNWRHGQSGHLFQGRYHAIVVDKLAYLLELLRYLALNPVRAGLVKDPADWPWSSFPATIGRTPAVAWLESAWPLEQFAPKLGTARRRYAAFVADGLVQSPGWQPEPRRGVLGGTSFRRSLAKHLGGEGELAARPSLGELASQVGPRGAWMSEAQRKHGYRQREIAAFAGLERSAVSKIISRWRLLESSKATCRPPWHDH